MKNFIGTIVISTAILFSAIGRAEQHSSILVAGDSWAALICINSSLALSLLQHGIKNVTVTGCLEKTSKLGAHADRWFKYPESKNMFNVLKKNTRVKVVYLSIGGNDFLGSWNKNMSLDEEQISFDNIRLSAMNIVNKILEIRPDVKILVSGYDFGNFKDYTRVGAYTRLYNDLGRPTPYELNSAFIRFTSEFAKIANFENVFFIHHIGLSHYYFGSTGYGLKPHMTKPPDEISNRADPLAYGGVPELVTDKYSMLNLGPLYIDAYHPNFIGFWNIANHAMDNYIADWLK